MVKKHLLNDVIALNCRVYGVVSPKPFIEIAYHIRKRLHLPLQRFSDIEWRHRHEKCYNPVYGYLDEQIETDYRLIRNKADQGILAPEFKNVDAFIVETNFTGVYNISLEILNQSKFAQYCFTIEPGTFKKESQKRLDLN